MSLKSDRLEQFFQKDGRTVILPIDHGSVIPVPGLENPGKLIKSVRSHVDGFVVNLGLGKAFQQELAGRGVCLRTDVYRPDIGDGSSFKTYGPDEAEEIDGSAMMQMLYPGHPNEVEIARECAETIAEGYVAEMPTIIETLPCGLGKTNDYTVEKISFAVRQAAELGADVVKTAFPAGASSDDFKAIIDACFVPVIVLGGAAMGDDKALLSMVHDAISAGAAGVAIGRNVWQHSKPKTIAKRIAAVVHDDASASQAMKIR